jgi:hypothetical protein
MPSNSSSIHSKIFIRCLWNRKTLSEDFEQVTQALNESDDVVDMYMYRNASCEQYVSTRHSLVKASEKRTSLEM